MRVRVVTNGKYYRIQVNVGKGWEFHLEGPGETPYNYDKQEYARKWAEELHWEHVKVSDTWEQSGDEI